MAVGEKVDALEAFHPDRVASRILGMGDVLSLIEEVEQKIDKDKANKLARKTSQWGDQLCSKSIETEVEGYHLIGRATLTGSCHYGTDGHFLNV